MAALVALAGLWSSGWMAPAYFRATAATTLPPARVLLPGMAAEIDGQPVAGLVSNLSGLTYSTHSHTLFSVLNTPPTLVELSRDGRLLRQIPIRGATDTEGITHVAGDRFILADEGDQSLHWITLGPETSEITLGDGPFLSLEVDAWQNMGFEGLSWDSRHNRLFVVQEMLPARVLMIEGLGGAIAGDGMAMTVREWPLSSIDALALIDLSSVTYNEATDRLLLLSHMSAMVAEFAPDGAAVAHMSLQGGAHGLHDGIAQAEGIATDGAGTVYIVSEPNLFYRFAKAP